MTHDELLYQIDQQIRTDTDTYLLAQALRAVVELHTGSGINNRCVICANGNKCETIQVIEKELT